ncbi:hypothetical protein D5066_10950 [Enterobacter chuandaensis]|nr:hypothetical protein D5066_10950 [Enterobacter chuandaensis]
MAVLFFGNFNSRLRRLANCRVFTVEIAVDGGFIERDGPALTTMLTAFPTDTGKICDQFRLGNNDLFHGRILKIQRQKNPAEAGLDA